MFYLAYNENYALAPRGIHNSFLPVLRAILVIVPLMVGFAFLGIMIFSSSPRFQSFGDAMFVILASMNGD